MRIQLKPIRAAVLGLMLASAASSSLAFDSGSTGADGALAPTVDTEIQLPPSGVLNYTSITIPANVTVRFKKNVTNTPVVLLVAGDATITGTIDVSGSPAAPIGAGGNGVLADDGNPGEGGPGGFAGGRGGQARVSATGDGRLGAKGLGPGGGQGGKVHVCGSQDYSLVGYGSGAGGSFGAVGEAGHSPCGPSSNYAEPGPAYGSVEILPLIGGSGGGGGNSGNAVSGGGGGGGGGAILIAVSGTLTVSGGIYANGRNGGTGAEPSGCGSDNFSAGGGGSGGAVRIVATQISGNGQIQAMGSAPTYHCQGNYPGGSGGAGRIRLEAEAITRSAGTSPAFSLAQPGPVFIGGAPTLTITSVAGVSVPQPPTGVADVKLPATTTNPVTINFTTTGIPVGNTVKLSVVPRNGPEVTAVSTALTGSTANATASASIDLPAGASTLQASVIYTVVVSLGESLSRFAQGERVERISVTAGLDGKSVTRLITLSGREFVAPPEALRLAALGG